MNKKCPLCDEPAVISHELTTTNVVYCGNPACPCNWHGMTEEVWNHRPEEERLQARITELEARLATLRIELDKADGAGQELMAENETLRTEVAALKEAWQPLEEDGNVLIPTPNPWGPEDEIYDQTRGEG